MKRCPAAVLFLLVVMKVFSQPGNFRHTDKSLDSITGQLRRYDDAANFIYTYLDTFLVNPTENRMIILENCERSLWRPLKSDDEYIAYVILLCNKGYYAGRFGDINKAVNAYETAWKLYTDHKLEGFDIIEYCLKPLGNNYSKLGDYQSAANIIRHYLFLSEKEGNTTQLVSAFINLSVVYHDTGRQEEAIDLLKSALEIKDIQELKRGIICSNLARNYLDIKQETEAQRYALLALKNLNKSNSGEASLHLANTLKILSMLSLNNGDMNMALSFTEKARSIISKNPTLFQKRDLAKVITAYAGIKQLQHYEDIALQNYQQALMMLLPGYKPENDTDLPDKSLLYPENTLKETLDGLGQLFSKNDRVKALQCFELSFTVDDLLRQTYNYQEDRLRQQVEIRNRTEQSLTLLFDLFEQTKDHQLVRKAFQLAERTKAVVLREAIEANARNQLVRHDSLLKNEYDLTFKKAKLATDLVLEQMKGGNANVEYINELISRQTKLSIEIKSLQELIVQKYPQYVPAGSAQPIDVERLQKKLARENATLMEYVAGEEALYAFIVEPKSISFHKISGVAVYNNIRRLNDLFSSAARINNDIGLYKRVAFDLNRLLRVPISTTSENLVIIPDGLLNYVPFEALLIHENSSVNYASLPYLIKKFAIAYEPSAISFIDHKKRPPVLLDNNRILAMFPVFRNSHRALQHSETEANSIQSFTSGKFLFEDNATKKAFEENLNNYNIIHLSTHAGAGSWLEPPSIDFIDSTLYLPEVYGLHLQPDLMVLSACETGVGKMLKGEGALSLARGFQYAGAHNLIFSLWNVNDQSTARLISSFYGYYFGEESSPQALRLAKLDYLENKEISNSQKSPYFWAAFVYYGDLSKDHPTQDSNIKWYEILLLVLAFLFLMIIFLKMPGRFRGVKK